MDKFLMSSPTQLSQPFEIDYGRANENGRSRENGKGNQIDEGIQEEEIDDGTMYVNDPSNELVDSMSDDEMVPISANSREHFGMSRESGGDLVRESDGTTPNLAQVQASSEFDFINYYHPPNSSQITIVDDATISDFTKDLTISNLELTSSSSKYNFNHSKNMSLDDDIYGSHLASFPSLRISHRSNLSTSSMMSINQDPPTTFNSAIIDYNNLNHSFSSNTVYSMDSIPQLSSSVLNQSLSDSPSSMHHSKIFQNQPMATPRRVGRKKSLSVSSATNTNLYNTPLRAPTTATALSPVNRASVPKVTKTPHSKGKGHSRSKSTLSMTSSNTLVPPKSTSFQNLYNQNPFFTPNSFVSPRVDNISGDIDDIGTPLPTPGSASRLLHPGYNSDLHWTSSNGSSASKNNTFGTPLLKRNDTLESIHFEEQDDDAFKQLKKAKSYSSISLAHSTSNPMLRNKQSQSLKPHDESYLVGDLRRTEEDSINILSSSSTPGAFYSPQTVYNNNITMTNSVPTSGVDDNAQISMSSGTYRGKGIDLLLLQFVTEQTNGNSSLPISQNRFNRNLTKNLSQSASSSSFTKSYPASIDLASIATSPMDSSLSAPPTLNQGFQNIQHTRRRAATLANSPASSNMVQHDAALDPAGLLPPMATFPNSLQATQQMSLQHLQQQKMQLQQSLQLQQQMLQKQQIDFYKAQVNHGNNMPMKAKFESVAKIESAKADKKIKGPTDEDLIDPKKKHACPICDSRFQRPEHVKRHMKSHSSEKPFECDQPDCGKRFNRKDNLKAHLKKIHGIQFERIREKGQQTPKQSRTS
jgi:uncharacterized C2H2 Zn-finger protein